jgi:hypothetical protein
MVGKISRMAIQFVLFVAIYMAVDRFIAPFFLPSTHSKTLREGIEAGAIFVVMMKIFENRKMAK